MRFRFLSLSSVILLLCTGTGYSQTFTGMLDGYWSYNSNTPAFHLNTFRILDQKDQSFTMNYGELAVDYKPDNVGIRVDIGFGDTAEIIHFNPADRQIWRHIQQAYITGTKGKFTVDFGKFVTPVGPEVIETKDNWNYTRGLLFTFATPLYHFGAKSTYVVGDKATLVGYVVNGWNNVQDNNSAKSVGFVGIFKPMDKVGVTTNFLVGKENTGDGYRQLYNGIVAYRPTGRISVMANYDYIRDRSFGPGVFWQGVAVYGKAKVSEKFTAASRYEWFGDRHRAFRTGSSENLQSFTATSQTRWSDLTFWGEYRRDWSDLLILTKFKGLDTIEVNSQNTFTLGLTYSITKTVQ